MGTVSNSRVRPIKYSLISPRVVLMGLLGRPGFDRTTRLPNDSPPLLGFPPPFRDTAVLRSLTLSR